MKPLSVFSLYYGGPISYWKELVRQEVVYLVIHEAVPKKSYINRMVILTANGPLTLSIPLMGGRGQKTSFKEIAFAHNEWKHNHLHALQSAYSKSPFYEFYMPKLEMVYRREYDYLFQFNRALLDAIGQLLKWSPRVEILEDSPHTVLFDPSIPKQITPYPQVFRNKYPFEHDASIFDLLFNVGNRSMEYLKGDDKPPH